MRRIRGAVRMDMTWAAGWTLLVVLLGVTSILLPGLGLEVIFEAADDELLIVGMRGSVNSAFLWLSSPGSPSVDDELSAHSLPR